MTTFPSPDPTGQTCFADKSIRRIVETIRLAGLGCWIICCLALLGAASPANAQDTVQDQDNTQDSAQNTAAARTTTAGSQRPLEYWIGQLQHDEYLRREAASKRLMEAGDDAVPILADAIGKGDLETTTRVVRVLSDLALKQPASDDGGAWGALLKLGSKSTGSRQAISRTAIKEIRDAREVQALELLSDAGVFIGYDDFAVGQLTSQKFCLRIDDRFNGEMKTLQWLRWVRGIRYVSVHGDAVSDEAVARMVEMPQAHTIALVDGSLGPKGIAALSKMSRINSLEIRYVKLTSEMADSIAKLPLRQSLSLLGTDVSERRAERMKLELPGLSILNRKGGFLGVTCDTYGATRCQITTVRPGTAAYKAGLRPNDVVTEIDGEEIGLFADLQRVVGKHSAGDQLHFVIERYGNPVETDVILGQQLE
ncbi:PDZ domain-containing protein [Stieleria marina]